MKTASNMDGFYDQQVPFVYPDSVSFRMLYSQASLASFFLTFLVNFVPKFQKCHIEEGVKCLSERKRKFMDTELAQDTEGEFREGQRDKKLFQGGERDGIKGSDPAVGQGSLAWAVSQPPIFALDNNLVS